jgi:putative transposase
MPRTARVKSKTGIYHIIVRGINRQDIFHDDEDRKRYLDTLKRITVENISDVLGYCIMSNHVHLIIKEGEAGISLLMKRLGASYAYWYNLKYQRTGHVFQDRFKSENVEDDRYLLTVVRYVHLNPVKAQIVNKPEEYIWSSCRVYYGYPEYPPGLTQVSLVLDIFANQKKQAIENIRMFEAEDNEDRCLEDVKQKRLNEDAAFNLITEKLKGLSIPSLQRMPQMERKEAIKQLKGMEGLSIRQIARIIGLTYHEVYNA